MCGGVCEFALVRLFSFVCFGWGFFSGYFDWWVVVVVVVLFFFFVLLALQVSAKQKVTP